MEKSDFTISSYKKLIFRFWNEKSRKGEDILHRFNRLFLTDLTFVLYDRHCRQGNKKKCKI